EQIRSPIIIATKSQFAMILSSLYIDLTGSMGRGVFTSENISKGIIVEESPVIVMTNDERKLLDQTLLHDYIFEWGEKKDQCCMALGYACLQSFIQIKL